MACFSLELGWLSADAHPSLLAWCLCCRRGSSGKGPNDAGGWRPRELTRGRLIPSGMSFLVLLIPELVLQSQFQRI